MITKETHPEVFAKNDAFWKEARAKQAAKKAAELAKKDKKPSIKDVLKK